MAEIAAVILAAGGSNRMRRTKQALPVAGRAMMAHAVDACREMPCVPIVVVLGHDAETCAGAIGNTDDVIVVLNPDWHLGLGSSLRAGVRRAVAAMAGAASTMPTPRRRSIEEDSCFLLLADQPRVNADVLRGLHDARARSGRQVAVSAYGGTVGPPALVGADALARLSDWPDDRGAKELWTGRPADAVPVAWPDGADDVDTPEDYARLLSAWGQAGRR